MAVLSCFIQRIYQTKVQTPVIELVLAVKSPSVSLENNLKAYQHYLEKESEPSPPRL